MQNVFSVIFGQRRPRTASASAQSDKGLRYPLIDWLDTTECINGEQRPGRYFVHAQNYLDLRICALSKTFFCLIVNVLSFDCQRFALSFTEPAHL